MTTLFADNDYDVDNGNSRYHNCQNNDNKGYGFSNFKKFVDDNITSNVNFEFTKDDENYVGSLLHGCLLIHKI